MKDAKKLFHYISYLQYPLLLVAVFYCYRPFFDTLETLWADLNKGFVFLGLGISFSTLQDTTKTQNKISKRIFENPTYARRFIIVIVIQIIFFISLGMTGLLFSDNTPMQELSFGMIVLAIGIIGILKAAIEMAEHHRIKN